MICHQGKVRAVNQDNFWCNGRYLESDNKGLPTPISGSLPIRLLPTFAVFDGMGGEEKGEIASYIASKTFNKHYSVLNKQNKHGFLITACNEINNAICKYAAENNVRTMGTTGAFVLFDKNDVFICNIGDSPIFHYNGIKMVRISTDHVQENFKSGKPPLTQFLGIPESEFIIQPYSAKDRYAVGDKFLLCSDGLTDMVDLTEIEQMMSAKRPVEEAAYKLAERALENGGRDNITIVLCEICKEKILDVFKKGNRI